MNTKTASSLSTATPARWLAGFKPWNAPSPLGWIITGSFTYVAAYWGEKSFGSVFLLALLAVFVWINFFQLTKALRELKKAAIDSEPNWEQRFWNGLARRFSSYAAQAALTRLSWATLGLQLVPLMTYGRISNTPLEVHAIIGCGMAIGQIMWGTVMWQQHRS